MKNYSFTSEESKDFITSFSYEQEENVILINYASGKNIPALCNRENLIKILEKMKYQVINSEPFERKQKKKFRLALIMTILSSLMLGVTCLAPSLIILFVSILTLSVATNNMLKSYQLLMDIKKNKIFLDNSQELNAAIKNLTSNEISNMIETYSLKDATVIEQRPLYMNTENVPIVNLNTINDLSLEETEEIIKRHIITPKKKR